MSESSVRLGRWRLRLTESEFGYVHPAGIYHQAVDALFRLPTTNGCAEPIDEDKTIQCIFNYDNETCLVDPDADAYFKLEVADLFKVLPVTSENVQIDSIAKLLEAQKADFLCERLTATGGKLGAQFDSGKKRHTSTKSNH